MKKIVLAAIAAAFIAGCATDPTEKIVEVPVPVVATEPAPTVRPHLAIEDLEDGAEPAAVVLAYRATVEALIGYVKELEAALEGYRAKKEPPK